MSINKKLYENIFFDLFCRKSIYCQFRYRLEVVALYMFVIIKILC